MNGLPYYKAYPRDFIEGTVGMSFEHKAAYRLVLDLIYMQGGRLPDDARYISGLLGCSVKKWNALRIELIMQGKIEVFGSYLGNNRADKELETLGKFQDEQRKKSRKPRKNKDLQQPRPSHTEPDTDISVTNVTDGGAVDNEIDFAKAIFDRGVKFLCKHGIKETQARSLIGKWRQVAGDKEVFDAFAACNKAGATDPVSWMAARLKPPEKRSESVINMMQDILKEMENDKE